MLKAVLLPAALLALWGAAAVAQETTATVTGTVSDQTGAVLPGVAVIARNTATGRPRRSDHQRHGPLQRAVPARGRVRDQLHARRLPAARRARRQRSMSTTG